MHAARDRDHPIIGIISPRLPERLIRETMKGGHHRRRRRRRRRISDKRRGNEPRKIISYSRLSRNRGCLDSIERERARRGHIAKSKHVTHLSSELATLPRLAFDLIHRDSPSAFRTSYDRPCHNLQNRFFRSQSDEKVNHYCAMKRKYIYSEKSQFGLELENLNAKPNLASSIPRCILKR